MVFSSLHQVGIRPRRAQVSMLFAEPNSGKSLLALYWVARLAKKYGTRVLYISADTDQHDTDVRLACMLTGHSYGDVDHARNSGKNWSFYQDVMATDTKSLAFCYETDPSYDYIADEVLAFNEIWGDYPEVIVIDNLGNVVPDVENEWIGLKNVTKALKRLGRQTGAAVITLHHANEKDSGDPTLPPRRSALTGKVSQFPELIIALSMNDAQGLLRVSSVKNRSGAKDARAGQWIDLFVDPHRMQIYNTRYERDQGIAA